MSSSIYTVATGLVQYTVHLGQTSPMYCRYPPSSKAGTKLSQYCLVREAHLCERLAHHQGDSGTSDLAMLAQRVTGLNMCRPSS